MKNSNPNKPKEGVLIRKGEKEITRHYLATTTNALRKTARSTTASLATLSRHAAPVVKKTASILLPICINTAKSAGNLLSKATNQLYEKSVRSIPPVNILPMNMSKKQHMYESYINTYEDFVNVWDTSKKSFDKAKRAHDILRQFQRENYNRLNYDPNTYQENRHYIHALIHTSNSDLSRRWIIISSYMNEKLRTTDQKWDELKLRVKHDLNWLDL